MVSGKVIERLSLYRRILERWDEKHVFSHKLAVLTDSTPARVRRDLMDIGFSGSPAKGYEVGELIAHINEFLDTSDSEGIILVGVGNLGKALLAYFPRRKPSLSIVAAFDRDSRKVGRTITGCPCYALENLSKIAKKRNARMAILAVPASEAQDVADLLIKANVNGILNFAYTRLQVPPDVYVENIDLTMSLEKVSFYAHQAKKSGKRKVKKK